MWPEPVFVPRCHQSGLNHAPSSSLLSVQLVYTLTLSGQSLPWSISNSVKTVLMLLAQPQPDRSPRRISQGNCREHKPKQRTKYKLYIQDTSPESRVPSIWMTNAKMAPVCRTIPRSPNSSLNVYPETEGTGLEPCG